MCLKDGCFLYLGQALPSAYLLPPLYRFGMHIAIGSGTVGIRSSCSGTAYRSGSDNRNPCCSRLCHIRTSKFVSQAFRFQCFICTFG